MFEALALLAVATVCVLGWIGGSRFVCVFLSIPVVIVWFINIAPGADHNTANAAFFALLVIWLPRMWWWATRRG